MSFRQIITTLLLGLLPLSVCSQQVFFKTYTVYDGLVANPVRCIYQDSKGFIWIGTVDGLSRYDGHKFTNYTSANGLSHNFINSIIEFDKKLLVAENNGAVDVFENNLLTKKYKAGSAVNFCRSMNGRLLFSSDADGLYEYKKDSLVLCRQDKYPYSLGAMLPLGDSLLLTAGVDDYFILYRKDMNIASISKLPGSHIYTLVEDSKKRKWACTSIGLKLLAVRDAPKPVVQFEPLPAEFNVEILRDGQVTSITENKDGSFWIGTLKGLVRIFPGGAFRVYNEKDGLPSARINSLYTDKEENLWIGTSLGLVKWVSKNHVVYFNTETQDFRNDVIAIASTDDRKFILRTDHGLQDFDLATNQFKNIIIPGNHYPVPIAGTSPLLIHYADRIGMLDTEKNLVVPVVKVDSVIEGVISAVMHPAGTVFLGTFGGLFAINQSSVKKIMPYRFTGLTTDMSGQIWAATWTDGLFRIKITNADKGLYEIIDMTPRIKEKQVRGLFADSRNNIWVGTRYAGAFRFTATANDSFSIQHFNRESGLMSDWVQSFAETNTHDIWIGTHLGLDKLIKESNGYRVFNFSKTVNFFAEIKKITPAGDHWICVANTGIALFKDEDLHHTAPLPPRLFTASLGTHENKIVLHSPAEKISLKPFQNAARFEFGALGFMNEKQIAYSYRLKGSSDSSWSEPENIHEASYASLSPGHYTFEVKTLGWNGQFSEPASFSFYIATPFWKQGWFIFLLTLTVLLLLYGLYRYRISQLLRLQQVRNNIATDLHDDIGSTLTNISILSELSSKNLSEPEKARPFLQRISEEVQASSQAMDDIIWSVNSRNDSLQETLARMRRYAAELFDNSETSCHLVLDENSGKKKLTMEQRRDVYLIYKEALNNIHKHAGAKHVWVKVTLTHNDICMYIKDDGKGFNTDQATHRNGLKNVRARVEKWKGWLNIASETNKGTSIEVKIPLKG